MRPNGIMNGKPRGHLVEKICQLVRTAKVGDIFTREEFAHLAEEAVGSQRYYGIVGTAKKRIERELNVALQSLPGVGYQYPTGFEQSRGATGTMRRGVKSIALGASRAVMVTDDRLPDLAERNAHHHLVQQLQYLASVAKTYSKPILLIIGKPEALPRLTK